jgi:uncharacterized protein DUF1573/peptidase C39-like protein
MSKHLAVLCMLWLSSGSAIAKPDRPLAENPYALDVQKSCGPLCIGFIDRYFGGTRHYNEIAALCPPGAVGINLESAESALQKLGYHTRTVRLTPGFLKALRWPCIIHEDNGSGTGHFVVCTGWRPKHETFQFYSPPMTLNELNFGMAKQRYGTALAIVVSLTPLPSANELVPAQWSWRSIFGIEVILIGVLLLFFGRSSGRIIQSALTRATALVLATLFSSAGCHQSTPPISGSADDVQTIDLGQVQADKDLEATFRVQNHGNSSFRIVRVERSCRCQDVRFDSQQDVPVEGETTVSVVVPIAKKAGPMRAQFVVHTTSSDPSFAMINLTLKANVVVPLWAIPSEMMIGPGIGTDAVRQLRVEADQPNLISKYTSVTFPDFINVKLLNRDRSGLLFAVQRSSDAPNGTRNGTISVRFDHPEFPVLNVPVTSQKMGPIRIIPAKLRINGRAGEQTLKVLIASTTARPFRLLSVSAPAGMTPKWNAQQEPQIKHQIEVSCTNPQVVDGHSIAVSTDLPEEPSVQIPISVHDLP